MSTPKTLFLFAMYLAFPFVPLKAQSEALNIHHPDHPDNTEYLRDSLKIVKHIGLGFNYYWKEQYDSILAATYIMEELAVPWMTQDTFSKAVYQFAKSINGQVRCEMGYYADGLPEFVARLENMAQYTGNDDVAFHVSTSYIGLGRIYESLGYFDEALEAYLEGDRLQAKLVEKGKLDPVWLAYKANYLADIYWKLEQFNESEKLFLKAISITLEAGIGLRYDRYHFDLLALYISTGAVNEAHSLRDSIETYLSSVSSITNNIPLRVFMYHKTLADAYYDIDSLWIAEKHYEEVLKTVKQYPLTPREQEANAVPFCYYQLARIYLRTSKTELVKPALDQARSSWLKDHPQDGDLWTRLLLLEGEWLLQEQQGAAALSLFNGILKKYYPNWMAEESSRLESVVEWPLSPFIMEALRGRLEVLTYSLNNGKGNPELSAILNAADLAQQYLEYFIQTYSTDYSRAKIFSDNRAVYDIPVRLLHKHYQTTRDPKTLERLFYVFEKSKTLQLLSTIKEKQLQSSYGIPDTLMRKERNLRREIAFYKKKLASFFRSEQDSTDLKTHYQDVLAQLVREAEDLEAFIQDQYKDYYRFRYDLSVVNLPELQNFLPPEKAVLSYFWGADRIYVVSVRRDQVDSWSVVLDSTILANVNQFTNLVRTPPRAKVDNDKRKRWALQGLSLYQALVLPAVQRYTNIKHWVLFPDGILWYLPWAALLTEPVHTTVSFRDLPYLIRNHALQQEYSATLMLEDIPRKLPLYSYLGVAPEYNNGEIASGNLKDGLQLQRAFRGGLREGYIPLPYSSQEVDHASQFYKKGIQLVGTQATEAAFKQYAGKSKVLHLAMHALTNDIDPMLSHLVFNKTADSLEDGLLYAYEIYNMDIPSELAILSACNTGAGTILDGQGVMSIARAFKYAGCRDVMMTLWPANDHATTSIISDFFEQLESNDDKAKALQQAMKGYLEGQLNEGRIHPFYWSGFTLIGTGNSTTDVFLNHCWLWVLLLGIFLLVGYFRVNR